MVIWIPSRGKEAEAEWPFTPIQFRKYEKLEKFLHSTMPL
jgi:hypothetical protein